MREACKDVLSIPWIRPDLQVEMPPLGTKEYGAKMTERAKAKLGELAEMGEMGKDGVYWY